MAQNPGWSFHRVMAHWWSETEGPGGAWGKAGQSLGFCQPSPGLTGLPCCCWAVLSADFIVYCWRILSWKCYVVNYTANELWGIYFQSLLLQVMRGKSIIYYITSSALGEWVRVRFLKGGTFVRRASGVLRFLASRCIICAFSLFLERLIVVSVFPCLVMLFCIA